MLQMPALLIRCNKAKADAETCFGRLYEAVPLEQLEGITIFEGDSAATLSGAENVYTIAMQHRSPVPLAVVKKHLESDAAFMSVCDATPFVTSAQGSSEPLKLCGMMLSGKLSGEGSAAHAALQSFRERYPDWAAVMARPADDTAVPYMYGAKTQTAEPAGAFRDVLAAEKTGQHKTRRAPLTSGQKKKLIIFVAAAVVVLAIVLLAILLPGRSAKPSGSGSSQSEITVQQLMQDKTFGEMTDDELARALRYEIIKTVKDSEYNNAFTQLVLECAEYPGGQVLRELLDGQGKRDFYIEEYPLKILDPAKLQYERLPEQYQTDDVLAAFESLSASGLEGEYVYIEILVENNEFKVYDDNVEMYGAMAEEMLYGYFGLDYDVVVSATEPLDPEGEKEYYSARSAGTGTVESGAAITESTPESGELYSAAEGTFGTIRFTADKQHAYASIADSSGSLVKTVFIRAGESVDIQLPKGTYSVGVASGEYWEDEQTLFGADGGYRKLEQKFKLASEGEGYEIRIGSIESDGAGRPAGF